MMRILMPALLALSLVACTHEPQMVQTDAKEAMRHQTGLWWVRNSAEFSIIASRIFEDATQTIDRLAAKRPESAGPWIVALDGDETVLDNSQFQVEAFEAGRTYFDLDAWNAWVAREEAGAIPGAVDFLKHVLSRGGLIAIVTNRDAATDHHSLANLGNLGLPVESGKICVLGRSDEDKKAGHEDEWQAFGYGNDKDRRRRLLTEGRAENCWARTDGTMGDRLQQNWSQPADIVMFVGDNIRDLPRLDENIADDADAIRAVIADPRLVLLPNPVYGSWQGRDRRAVSLDGPAGR